MKVRNGQLSLGSIYKLFVAAWATAWTSLFGCIFVILVVVTLLTGEIFVNDQVVQGRIPALLAMSPMLVLFPVVVLLQSFIFAAFLTGGVWLYRKIRPLQVIVENDGN